jgi:hypothetical protein
VKSKILRADDRYATRRLINEAAMELRSAEKAARYISRAHAFHGAFALTRTLGELRRALTALQRSVSKPDPDRYQIRAGAREISQWLTLARVEARSLVSELNSAFDYDRSQRALNRARLRASRLERAIARALDQTAALGIMFEYAPESASNSASIEMKRSKSLSFAIVNVAVSLLPRAEQVRYAEEYRAELSDHSSGLAKVAYACRLVHHSWSLRQALIDDIAAVLKSGNES